MEGHNKDGTCAGAHSLTLSCDRCGCVNDVTVTCTGKGSYILPPNCICRVCKRPLTNKGWWADLYVWRNK